MDHQLPNSEQGCHDLIAQGVTCEAATRGARGALVVTADRTIEVPAYAVDVVDTTGLAAAGLIVIGSV